MATRKKAKRVRSRTIVAKPIAKHFVKMQCPYCLKTSITIIATLNDEVIQLPGGGA